MKPIEPFPRTVFVDASTKQTRIPFHPLSEAEIIAVAKALYRVVDANGDELLPVVVRREADIPVVVFVREHEPIGERTPPVPPKPPVEVERQPIQPPKLPKLSPARVQRIKTLHSQGFKQAVIAKRLGVSPQAVRRHCSSKKKGIGE